MVIEQVSDFPSMIRRRIDTIIDKIGTNTYTLYSIINTTNTMGRLSDRTKSESTITGFLSKIGPQDKQLIELGWVNIGDAVFYTDEDVSISENDELKESGETDRWTFTKRRDYEKIEGSKIFQSWFMTKRV